MITRERVEHILRACVAERDRRPESTPGQTELLCRALLDEADACDEARALAIAIYQHAEYGWPEYEMPLAWRESLERWESKR